MEEQRNLVDLYNKIKPVHYATNNPESNFPRKRDETDCTFPISIVSRTGNRIDDQLQGINEFSTDMVFIPPIGFYIEIHGTDELLKRGYALFQTKIVQPKSVTPVRIQLYKFTDSEDLTLPFHSGLSLVLRHCNYAHLKKQRIEMDLDEIQSTTSSHSVFSNKYESTRVKSFFE